MKLTQIKIKNSLLKPKEITPQASLTRVFFYEGKAKLGMGLLFVCFLLILQPGCGGGGAKKKTIYPAEVNQSMQGAFAVADNYYNKRNYQSALESYQSFINTFPHNHLTDESYYKIGKINFVQQKWDLAIEAFKTLVQKTPDPAYRAKAQLLAGLTAHKKNDYVLATNFLESIHEDDLSIKLQLQFYSLKIMVGEKLNIAQNLIDFAVLKMADLYQASADRDLKDISRSDFLSYSEVMSRLEAWIVSPMTVDEIPQWLKNIPPGFSRGFVNYKLGKVYFEVGQKDKAVEHLSRFLQTYPKHVYADGARKMLQESGGVIPTSVQAGKVIKIGVILPLTGLQAVYGAETMHGIKCAVGEEGCRNHFSQLLDEVYRAELIIRDSGSDTERVVSLVNELKGQDVSAIIGPMSGPLALAAVSRADQVKVPLLAITQKASMMKESRYLFQMGYPVDQQVTDVVARSNQIGLKSFGIFYPNSSYGEALANQFEAEVQSHGGKVLTKVSYNPAELNLVNEARKLKNKIQRFSYAGQEAGFQALFIPDSFSMINRLLSSLQVVNIQNIPLIGTNAWNDPRLSTELAQAYPNSFFLDIYYEGNGGELNSKFVNDFLVAFGKAPTSLAALGFDAALFVGQAVQRSGDTQGSKLREALFAGQDFQGVTNIRSFVEGVGPRIDPVALTVGVGGIVQAR